MDGGASHRELAPIFLHGLRPAIARALPRGGGRLFSLLLVGVVAAAGVACGADGGDSLAVVRDSGGVAIVENAPDGAERVPRWIVGPEPRRSIGASEGDPHYLFHDVLDARLLSDGRIAVVDWGSRQVRLFGADGRLVAAQGGEGQGPGEYLLPRMLWLLPGDSIAVYDPRQDRITVLATLPTGLDLARVVPTRRRIMLPLPAGSLEDGRRLVVLHRPMDATTPIQPRMGALWALSLDSLASDSLMELPQGSFGRIPGGEKVGLAAGSPIFAGLSGWARARGDRLVYGSGQAYTLRVADAHGTTTRIIRWHGPDRRVTEDEVRTWMDSMVARARPEQRPLERTRWENMPVAETKPAHGRILMDSAGRIWVNRWDLWADNLHDGPEWWVFDPDGRMVATARMPDRFYALDLGDGVVLGSLRDDLDVERLVLLPVTAAAP